MAELSEQTKRIRELSKKLSICGAQRDSLARAYNALAFAVLHRADGSREEASLLVGMVAGALKGDAYKQFQRPEKTGPAWAADLAWRLWLYAPDREDKDEIGDG